MTRDPARPVTDLPVVGNSEPGGGETPARKTSIDCISGRHWLFRLHDAAPEDPWTCRLCPHTEPFLGRTL